MEGVDFNEIEEESAEAAPDLMIGNSKGYKISSKLGVPLVRLGFPIHDRFGGHRTLHIGYSGALSLLDTIINKLIDLKQESSPVGYSYL